MQLARISYEQFADMDEQQRQDYSESWRYIHRSKTQKEREDD